MATESKNTGRKTSARRSNIRDRNTAIAKDGGKPVDDPKPTITAKPMDRDASGLIRIRGRVKANRFALVESHHGHPGGEVQLMGTDEADVWPTEQVMRAVHEGRIEVIG